MEHELHSIKDKIINKTICISALFIGPVYAISLLRVFQIGWHINFIFNGLSLIALLILYFFRKKINLIYKIHAFSIIFLLIAVIGFFMLGSGSGYYFCLVPIFLTGLLLGVRTAFCYLLVTLAAYSIKTIAFFLKISPVKVDFELYFNLPATWLIIIGGVFYVALIVLIAINELYSFLINTVEIKTKNEQEIKQKEQFIRSLGDNLPNGMIYQVQINNVDNTRKFTYLSAGIEKMHQLKAEQVLEDANVLYNRILDEDLEYVGKQEEFAMRNMLPFKVEARYKSPDGSISWHLLSSTPQRISDQIVSWDGIELDITDRINFEKEILQAKKRAEKSEKQYRMLIETAMFPIAITSVNAKIFFVNHAAEIFFGANLNELSEPSSLNFWADEEARTKFVEELNVAHFVHNIEIELYTAKKEIRTVILSSNIIEFEGNSAILTILNDISDRKKNEEELKKYRDHLENLVIERTLALDESEKKFRTLFEISPDTITFTNEKGQILDCNKAMMKFLGLSHKEELIGTNIKNIYVNPVERDVILQEILIHNGLYNREVRLRTYQNEIKTSLLSVEILHLESGVMQFIGWNKDITERKKIETELQNAKTEAEAANYAKSEFLSNMSHELRTPLNAILGFSKQLRYQKNITEQQKDQLTTVYQCGEHLLSLINDILDMSKIEAQKLELVIAETNLHQIINTVFNINKVKAEEKGLEYFLEVNGTLPEFILGDERKLKQIMLNLINNAIKFTDEGGINVKVEYFENNEVFVFQIRDTGIGIPYEKQTEIFEPFVQHTDKKLFTEGTGLGLSISKKLIEIMDGTITLKSEPGHGSIFLVEIPLKAVLSNHSDKSVEDSLIISYIGEQKRILIVDDNHSNLSFLTSLLENTRFMVETAINGKIALEKLPKFNPDLILLDYRMPVMDGLAFILNVRNNEVYRNIKIIGISATVHQKRLKKQFHDACDDFVPKPVDTYLLFQKIKDLLQLEWIYETREEPIIESVPLIIPGYEMIVAINEAAEIGLFNSIDDILQQLVIENKQYTRFAEEIKKLAKRFDSEGIIKFINNLR